MLIDRWLARQKITEAPNVVRSTPEGFQLIEGHLQRPDSAGAEAIFILVFCAGMILFCFGLLLIYLPRLTLLSAIGLALITAVLAKSYLLSKILLLPGRLTLSSHPLHLGQHLQIGFSRSFRRHNAIKRTATLTLKIACVEQVIYHTAGRASTKSRAPVIKAATVWESEPHTFSVPPGASHLSCCTEVFIPASLPPSFEAEHNQIRWVAWIYQTLPGWFKEVRSDFTFWVDPVIES